jgi:hypothetical protein
MFYQELPYAMSVTLSISQRILWLNALNNLMEQPKKAKTIGFNAD